MSGRSSKRSGSSRSEWFMRMIGDRKEHGAHECLGRRLVGLGTRVRCLARAAHVKRTPMCANSRFGRARRRPRMSLSGLWLLHGLRGGCAAPETEAVVGATPLFRCPVWHLGGLGCARHPNLPGVAPIPSVLAGRPLGPPGASGPQREPGTLQDTRWKRTLTTRCTSSSSRVVASITDSLIHGTDPGLTRPGQRYRATSVEPS